MIEDEIIFIELIKENNIENYRVPYIKQKYEIYISEKYPRDIAFEISLREVRNEK